MSPEEILKRVLPIFRSYIFPIVLGSTGLLLIVSGFLFQPSPQESEAIEFLPATQEEKELEEIVVDIEGAVLAPGVYTLSVDTRLHDALIASGGFSQDADRDWIAKNVNLAARLSDGAKIYIPAIGEEKAGTTVYGSQTTAVDGRQLTESRLININTASAGELDSLPGIGQVTADKIINGRPYGAIDELLSKKIVGSKVFSDIKGKITTN